MQQRIRAVPDFYVLLHSAICATSTKNTGNCLVCSQLEGGSWLLFYSWYEMNTIPVRVKKQQNKNKHKKNT